MRLILDFNTYICGDKQVFLFNIINLLVMSPVIPFLYLIDLALGLETFMIRENSHSTADYDDDWADLPWAVPSSPPWCPIALIVIHHYSLLNSINFGHWNISRESGVDVNCLKKNKSQRVIMMKSKKRWKNNIFIPLINFQIPEIFQNIL